LDLLFNLVPVVTLVVVGVVVSVVAGFFSGEIGW
jgi:ABC-type microcin C transport system permease subunit YejE